MSTTGRPVGEHAIRKQAQRVSTRYTAPHTPPAHMSIMVAFAPAGRLLLAARPLGLSSSLVADMLRRAAAAALRVGGIVDVGGERGLLRRSRGRLAQLARSRGHVSHGALALAGEGKASSPSAADALPQTGQGTTDRQGASTMRSRDEERLFVRNRCGRRKNVCVVVSADVQRGWKVMQEEKA